MANKIVKGVMTIDGVAQIDYTSLANLPTIDTIPTFRSANAVQSGAVYDALAGKMDATNGVVQNPVFEWKGEDGSTVSFKQVTSDGKSTFGFVHTAANGTMTFYPFMETTTEGHKTLFAEAEHEHNASDISSGTLHADRLPVLPAAKLETVPINKGGTGATTAANALKNLGLTVTASELNAIGGVTGNLQEQLNSMMPKAGGKFTGEVTYTTLSGGNITSTGNISAGGTITATGNITGAKVYGAVWNDYAEFRNATEEIEPGRIVCENGDDTVSLATERLQPGALATSDTYGFAIGETEECKCPIAVAGRVLVFPYEDRDSYAPGDPVCAAPGGTVSKMTREEVVMYPDRIVGTVSAIPAYETWSSDEIKVQNRIWIKI